MAEVQALPAMAPSASSRPSSSPCAAAYAAPGAQLADTCAAAVPMLAVAAAQQEDADEQQQQQQVSIPAATDAAVEVRRGRSKGRSRSRQVKAAALAAAAVDQPAHSDPQCCRQEATAVTPGSVAGPEHSIAPVSSGREEVQELAAAACMQHAVQHVEQPGPQQQDATADAVVWQPSAASALAAAPAWADDDGQGGDAAWQAACGPAELQEGVQELQRASGTSAAAGMAVPEQAEEPAWASAAAAGQQLHLPAGPSAPPAAGAMLQGLPPAGDHPGSLAPSGAVPAAQPAPVSVPAGAFSPPGAAPQRQHELLLLVLDVSVLVHQLDAVRRLGAQLVASGAPVQFLLPQVSSACCCCLCAAHGGGPRHTGARQSPGNSVPNIHGTHHLVN
jgi:hypothetical protein